MLQSVVLLLSWSQNSFHVLQIRFLWMKGEKEKGTCFSASMYNFWMVGALATISPGYLSDITPNNSNMAAFTPAVDFPTLYSDKNKSINADNFNCSMSNVNSNFISAFNTVSAATLTRLSSSFLNNDTAVFLNFYNFILILIKFW